MVLGFATGDGRQFEARIVDIGEQDITIDLNHPLAGKTLTFTLKVVTAV